MNNKQKLTESWFWYKDNKNLLTQFLENQEQILKRINDIENKNRYPFFKFE